MVWITNKGKVFTILSLLMLLSQAIAEEGSGGGSAGGSGAGLADSSASGQSGAEASDADEGANSIAGESNAEENSQAVADFASGLGISGAGLVSGSVGLTAGGLAQAARAAKGIEEAISRTQKEQGAKAAQELREIITEEVGKKGLSKLPEINEELQRASGGGGGGLGGGSAGGAGAGQGEKTKTQVKEKDQGKQNNKQVKGKQNGKNKMGGAGQGKGGQTKEPQAAEISDMKQEFTAGKALENVPQGLSLSDLIASVANNSTELGAFKALSAAGASGAAASSSRVQQIVRATLEMMQKSFELTNQIVSASSQTRVFSSLAKPKRATRGLANRVRVVTRGGLGAGHSSTKLLKQLRRRWKHRFARSRWTGLVRYSGTILAQGSFRDQRQRLTLSRREPNRVTRFPVAWGAKRNKRDSTQRLSTSKHSKRRAVR